MIVDKYGNYVRKFMWQLRGWDRVKTSLTVHIRAILKIVKSACNGIKKIKCTHTVATYIFVHSCHTFIVVGSPYIINVNILWGYLG
jgi:hypothetical protein